MLEEGAAGRRRAGDQVAIPAGKTLCEQGSLGREAFVILEGTAEVRSNDKKVASVGPGTCVGELALLDHGPRTATVIAETDVTALVIGVREFSAIVDEVPSIAHKLLRALAARIRDARHQDLRLNPRFLPDRGTELRSAP